MMTSDNIIRILDAMTGKELKRMVGDTDFDALGARDAGTAFAGVTYGCGFANRKDVEFYEGAVAIDSPKELLEL